MHNLRTILPALGMTMLILACALVGTPAPLPSGENVSTIVAATIQALTPAVSTVAVVPQATEAPTQAAQGVPVNYKNVSFVLPIAAAPETVPASSDQNAPPWDAGPEHIHFRFDGYNVPADSFSVTQIDIFPAQPYANANAGGNISLQRLQGVLGNPNAALTNDNLPQVPYFNAASLFAAQVKRIHFQNGDGVRVVSQYGQAYGPVTNNGTFYHFQGLTSDGKYYIIAVLPVEAPFLQNGNDPSAPLPAGGIPFPGYMADNTAAENYYQAVSDKLTSTPDDQFTPSLAQLDALVQSINVSP